MKHQTTQLLRELSTLLSVGIPLLEALQTLARQHRGRFQAVIMLLRERVAAGSSLAGAMGEQPEIFDELCINITEVGEDAGTLDVSLERLAGFRERYEQLRSRIGTSLLYPAIVTIVAVFASLFQMTFVVPRILEPLIEQGMPLPLPTRIVKGASDWVLGWWWLLMILAAGLVLAWTWILSAERGRRAWHRALLRLPVLGDLVLKQALVHISIVMATLLRSGVVFVRALQIAQRTTANLILRDALRRSEAAVTAGADVGQAMEETAAFPPMVVQVFALGQQSGRLEEMLDRLALTYDQEVSTAASRLTAILEPVLIIVLALFVLFIVLATVLPILEAGNAIQ
jgi:type II secretory pathway component PulF